jgi:Flp pilus assembly protein TadG
MIYRSRKSRRRAAVLVEAALVYPVLMLFLIGTITMGMGVLAYQQLSSLSREGARWASVRGSQYVQVTGNAATTQSSVYNTAILPKAAGLDTSQLTYSVTWSANQVPNPTNPPSSTVTVTLTYQWHPVANITGPVTITSTSVMPMSF